MGNILRVKEYVDLIGGELSDELSINDGEKILVTTAPGCWGPMITPSIRSGHEVSKPVKLNDSKIGDSVAIYIEKIVVKSKFASSGTGKKNPGRYTHDDPSVNAICPTCNINNPETILKGIGDESIVCKVCENPVIPQTISNGYTVIFNDERSIGVTVPKDVAEIIAKKVLDGEEKGPEGSNQHLATILAKSDISGLITRVKPMIGNIGCIPGKKIPSSKNAGDRYESLVSNDEFSNVEVKDLTDAHMDINSVCEGSWVICPIKVDGAGIYIGDVHSIQGNGELAGHTTDIISEVLVRVELIKGLELEGPIVIPPIEEVDYRFKPFTDNEYKMANELTTLYDFSIEERYYPLQFIGSGDDLNKAIDNCVDRISKLTSLSREEVMNRATISGEVEIGRTGGLIYITIMLSESTIEKTKLIDIVKSQYK